MRHFGSDTSPPGSADWRTLRLLLPYLWEFKWRVVIALSFLIGAKLAIVAIPIVLKHIVDNLNQPKALLVVPLALLFGYGLLRLASTVLADMRDIVFAKVTQRAVRRVGLEVFKHLHTLSLRFHLGRQTGGVTRDIERGANGISSLIQMTLFSVLPTLIEIALVAGILFSQFDWQFAAITLVIVVIYIALTISITEWRTKLRRQMNEMDSQANTRAIDSLLNYETVKYFGNEAYEASRYDASLQKWEVAAVKNQTSVGVLNAAQAFVIAIGMTLMLILASRGVVSGKLTVGDLVMINAFLIQMFIPLNFLGVMYRQIKQSLTDIERLFALLNVHREISDAPEAKALNVAGGAVQFEHVFFGYETNREILHGVSFEIPAGHNVAVVGTSGAGKSTLARLLYRFFDVNNGRITIDGQDIRHVTQSSLRAVIGIVPQDTVLFNNSIYFNIAYGRPDATRDEIIEAARAAHILHFIESLPEGWETTVGERGLKLSGGEKQRVAIARTVLKNPRILILDEATSALDTQTEKIIQAELKEIAKNRSTLTIAHRLSTIVDADQILVMEHGQIVERGHHRQLLTAGGVYAKLWALQQEEAQA
ncbi:MAG: metal ABC transporter permease [Halothiobacillus sp. 24-54-40]|jgi:ATP-binding cassette subfamily B protein|nr:MAG: metal ABC transporter permease [Halothiobacillus sp. 35-54-62]OYZ87314.1 MAG: metal ABC transporter permease [Halothiobacillus sp. 24-54-40]OZA80472.1 MAG: metal ABC transporter permease [Halothiobacillus sp. 39-53-45]HQS02405.1 ABC transporter ATP-binding protein/permease [Halothiobacillus sp.]HQS29315.1 ABC transporter ATP-binding protein/permease [Halothiobacillus sp.]